MSTSSGAHTSLRMPKLMFCTFSLWKCCWDACNYPFRSCTGCIHSPVAEGPERTRLLLLALLLEGRRSSCRFQPGLRPPVICRCSSGIVMVRCRPPRPDAGSGDNIESSSSPPGSPAHGDAAWRPQCQMLTQRRSRYVTL